MKEKGMRKRVGLSVCLALCLLLTVFSAVCLIACNSIITGDNNSDKTPVPTSFVCIDVNPSVELVVDQNNVVLSANGTNTDGKVLLFEEDGIIGAELDVAVSNIASLSIKYGFLKDGAIVSVDVVSKQDADKLYDKVSGKFASAVQKANADLSVSFSKSNDFVAERELDSLKAQYPDNQKIQDLDVATYRLVKKAEQNGIALLDALDMPLDKLLAKTNEIVADVTQKFDSSYRLAVERAQFLFDSAKQNVENGAYTKYYAQRLADSLTSFVPSISTSFGEATTLANQTANAARYTVANANKLSLEFYLSCLNVSTDNPRYVLSESDFESISQVLGDDAAIEKFKDKFTTESGKIEMSKEDFDAYVNMAYRNANDERKTKFVQNYNAALKTLANCASFDESDFNLAKETAAAATNPVKDLFEKIPSFFDFDKIFGDCLILDSAYASKTAIADAIARLDKIAADAKEKMQVTKEDEQAVKAMLAQSDAIKAIESARTALNTALDKAKADASAILLSMKNARLAK